ncbi:MAG TPA: hypothetical protein PLE39_08915 [Anaerolineales bacterium]|nr:hypothetical protein [Anaerolineales bacterium]
MTLPVAKSLREFLKNLIDYAGLFPPASLDLASALDEYKAYLPSTDNWMLGRFIISAADLSKLPNLSDAWHFSVLGRSGKNADEFAQNLENDLNDIRSFRQHQPAFADVFEVRLPSEATPDLLKYANEKITSQNKLTAYYEIPITPAWRENMTATIIALSESNQTANLRNGFKLRCGGVVADAFPSVEQIAHALLLCRNHHVPFKATAGLHHPIRHYNESVQTKMHGFVNVFGAAILAQAHNLNTEQTVAILNEEDPQHFRFTESHFTWGNFSVTADQIADSRRSQFISYGSCSFDEPREDMQKLTWLS